jgi:hypothetical protein
MEDTLKNILKKHTTFADLNDAERLQLVEWCADEQEFQSLKKLFQQVDVWSEQPTDDSNTKLRLDQLFAIQYAGKQSQSGGREIRFSKNRFSRVATWASVPAVAAALILTWYNYQSEPERTLAKNQPKTQSEVKQVTKEKKKESNLLTIIPTEVASESSNQEIPNEIASIEGPLPEKSERASDDIVTVVPDVSWSSSLANGSNVTLSTTSVGAATYSWTAGNLSEVQVVSSNVASKEKMSSRKKQADAFTSFSVKSMPEMLDVIVAAY